MKQLFCILYVGFFSVTTLQAQESETLKRYFDPVSSKNIIKTNLFGLTIRNFYFEYERILSKRFSLVLGYRTMPKGKLPLGNSVFEELSGGDQDTYDAISALRISNSAITPEIRWYVGRKGAGRGFYLAPFYRRANHRLSGVEVDYTNNAGVDNTIALAGELKSNTFGLQLGAQWLLSRSVSLDWWIVGPHAGSASVTLLGATKQPLTPSEQTDLKNELLDLGVFDGQYVTANVNANGASYTVHNAPWAGIKAGLCLGIRF